MSSIGEVAELLGVSAHTLRYYEKIGLLAPVSKTTSGRREFSEADIKRLQFIKRAQRMHFSLDEIGELIELDKAPSVDKPHARKLVEEKLSDIEASLSDLLKLKKDLSRMLVACKSSKEAEDCPIIGEIKSAEQV